MRKRKTILASRRGKIKNPYRAPPGMKRWYYFEFCDLCPRKFCNMESMVHCWPHFWYRLFVKFGRNIPHREMFFLENRKEKPESEKLKRATASIFDKSAEFGLFGDDLGEPLSVDDSLYMAQLSSWVYFCWETRLGRNVWGAREPELPMKEEEPFDETEIKLGKESIVMWYILALTLQGKTSSEISETIKHTHNKHIKPNTVRKYRSRARAVAKRKCHTFVRSRGDEDHVSPHWIDTKQFKTLLSKDKRLEQSIGKLKMAMYLKDVSLVELSRKTGIERTRCGLLLDGVEPTREEVLAISNVLEFPPKQLFPVFSVAEQYINLFGKDAFEAMLDEIETDD